MTASAFWRRKPKTSDEKAKDKEKEECTVKNRTEMERRDYS